MFDGWFEEFIGSQQYPALEWCSDLPMLTKLMLAADGSTTLLLEALSGSQIIADPLLPRSQPIPINDCPEVHKVFGNCSALAVRRSSLRDGTGMIVSENLITYKRVDRGTLIPADGTPFGPYVRNLGLFERRRIFRAGVTCATFGTLPAQSAGRVYEISFLTGQRVLVHEVFSPNLVPTRKNESDLSATPEREYAVPARQNRPKRQSSNTSRRAMRGIKNLALWT
jgi:hypothetical protein